MSISTSQINVYLSQSTTMKMTKDVLPSRRLRRWKNTFTAMKLIIYHGQWPCYRPGSNAIENCLTVIIKQEFQKKIHTVTSTYDLVARLQKIWRGLFSVLITRLYESILQKFRKVQVPKDPLTKC